MKIIYKNAVYNQVLPFHAVARDWNNDGDIYTEIVTVFELERDTKLNRAPWEYVPKKLIYNKWEFNDAFTDNKIAIYNEMEK